MTAWLAIHCSVGLLGLALTQAANAQHAHGHHSRIELSATQERFDSLETRNGSFFNQDKGKLTGLSARLSTPLSEKLTVSLGLEQAKGNLQYLGFTQTGLLVASRSATQVDSINLQLSRQFHTIGDWHFSPAWSLTPHLGVRWQRWDRQVSDIGLIPGFQEQMRSRELSIGTALSHQFSSNFLMRLGVSANRAIAHTMSVQLAQPADRFQVTPNNRWAKSLRLDAEHAFDAHWVLMASWHLHQHRPGSSATVQVTGNGLPFGTASYPGAHQSRQIRQLGIAYRF